MADFSDAVKKYGSTSAAFQALGYTKNENGSWTKSDNSSNSANTTSASSSSSSSSSSGSTKSSSSTNVSGSSNAQSAANRNINEYGYDPSLDYSAAIESAKLRGEDYSQLQTERDAKIAHEYGGLEPNMYGSNQTYTQLSGSAESGDTNAQDAIDKALRFDISDGSNYMGDNAIYKDAYEAAATGDWDKAASLTNQLAYTDSKGSNLSETNRYLYQLQNLFGYDADAYYNQRYDEAYGDGSAAVFDATGGAIKTYGDLVNAVGTEKAQEIVKNQIASNPSVYKTASGVKESATQQFGAGSQSLLESMSSTYGGNGNGLTSGSKYDLSEMIRSQKENELEAKLASLKGAFDKSESALDDALDRLPQEYDSARNEVAAQYAIAQRAFDERAMASGLNSGASGQAALARNSVLQKNLADIAQGQANATSDLELQKAQLVAEYQAAITEALEEGNAELAELLYEEMVRVQNLEREDALLAAEQEADALELALKYGTKQSGSGSGSATGSVDSTQKQTSDTKTPTSQTVDNGGLSTSQIKEMQNYYSVTADGLWGPESSKAAGGKSATDAWTEYQALKRTDTGLSAVASEIAALGLGGMSATGLEELIAYGGITENADGSLSWASGWSRSNYQRKLDEAKQRVIDIQKYLN